jgi:hypothetical protein
MAHVSVPTKPRTDPTAHLAAEEAAFRRKLPQLLKQYRGQYVALRHGRVIGHGPDDEALAGRVQDKLGKKPFYIARVGQDSGDGLPLPDADWVDDDLRARYAEFRRRLPEFIRRYPGQYVALYQGRVVGHHPDLEALGRRLIEKLGNVPFFIGQAKWEPDVVEISSPEIVW